MNSKECQEAFQVSLKLLKLMADNDTLYKAVEVLATEDDKILMSRYERGILQQSDSIKQNFEDGMSVGYASAIHDVLALLEQKARK